MKAAAVKASSYMEVPGHPGLYETTDYDQFTFDIRNRPIDRRKVQFFIDTFTLKRFYMRDCPALVDRNMIVVDGQHRLTAVEEMGLPFYFRFTIDLTIRDVTDIQSNAGWKTSDYIYAFSKQDKGDYITLNKFMSKYKMAVSIAARLLCGFSLEHTGLTALGFYDGTFKVKNEARAHRHAAAILECGEMCQGLNKDRSFCTAIIRMMEHPAYDHKRMVEQMGKYATLMRRHVTAEDYLRNLEDVYNYHVHKKNKIRFF